MSQKYYVKRLRELDKNRFQYTGLKPTLFLVGKKLGQHKENVIRSIDLEAEEIMPEVPTHYGLRIVQGTSNLKVTNNGN